MPPFYRRGGIFQLKTFLIMIRIMMMTVIRIAPTMTNSMKHDLTENSPCHEKFSVEDQFD